jgi:hypothetical protein
MAAQPFTSFWRFISPILPITSLLRIPAVAPARAKMGQMSNLSSCRRELRVLGSFRNFEQRQEAMGSFRKSLPSALQCSVYEISEIGRAKLPAPPKQISNLQAGRSGGFACLRAFPHHGITLPIGMQASVFAVFAIRPAKTPPPFGHNKGAASGEARIRASDESWR